MQTFRSYLIRLMGFLGSFKIPQVHLLSSLAYLGSKAIRMLGPKNTFKATAVICVAFYVALVFTVSGKAKIVDLVVESIPVAMIDKPRGPFAVKHRPTNNAGISPEWLSLDGKQHGRNVVF